MEHASEPAPGRTHIVANQIATTSVESSQANFFLSRTCRQLGAEDEQIAPLESFRELDAYVLVAAPGAGKTRAFKAEAENSGGHYITAQDFATFLDDTYAGKTLFIDGLDEVRADQGAAPLSDIRRHLRRLGNPPFRLSCREIDWLGDSDRSALAEVTSSGQEPTTLHLVPLTDEEILSFLEHIPVVSDPQAFMREAEQHRLTEILRNPQMLTLFAKAIASGDGRWPHSTAEVFERACRAIVVEANPRHEAAMRGRSFNVDQILGAAGFLSATLLLSGGAGFTVSNTTESLGITPLAELMHDTPALLTAALTSNLFVGVGEAGHTYIHRSIAEYLGGRFLAMRIESFGTPAERLLAMCTSADGGVTPALRGMCAWMSMGSRSARLAFVPLDPLGTVLYGDVRGFSTDDKLLVWQSLKKEALLSPSFRSGDLTPHPFGALATRDMLPSIRSMLAPKAASPGEQAFQDCVLESIRFGESMPEMEARLIEIARDAGYWNRVRQSAMEAIEEVSADPVSTLGLLLQEVLAGGFGDEDDEILGYLLERMYARGALAGAGILDYLRAPKDPNLIGSYYLFWSPHLAANAPKADLPILLKAFPRKREELDGIVESHRLEALGGDLLRKTLETYGESANDDDIYDWLGCVLDRYEHAHLDHSDQEFVSTWLSTHGDSYKAMILKHVERCRESVNIQACMNKMWSRLFRAEPPQEMPTWYLDRAGEEGDVIISRHLFDAAITLLQRECHSDILPEEKLDFVDHWLRRFPKMAPWLEDRTAWRIDDYRREHWERSKEQARAEAERRRIVVSDYRPYVDSLRAGNAPAGVLWNAAAAYAGRFYDGQGDTPRERLDAYFGNETDVIEAVLSALAKAVERPDLPRVDEIVSRFCPLTLQDPILIGMALCYETDPNAALTLNESILKRVVAFQLSKGDSELPDWYVALAQKAPALVADVLFTFVMTAIHRGDRYIAGLNTLTNVVEMEKVARLAIPRILEAFPSLCLRMQVRNCMNSLLKGALRYIAPVALKAQVARKISDTKLRRGQRTLWLTAGLFVDPQNYGTSLLEQLNVGAYEKELFAHFLTSDFPRRAMSLDVLPEATLLELVKLYGPTAPAHMKTGAYRRGADDRMGDLVRLLLRLLEQRVTDTVLNGLKQMTSMASLEPWHYQIQSALFSMRTARRTATAPKMSARAVTLVLSDNAPANAADLAALTYGHLRDLERLIRDESTNDYNQYWDTAVTPPKPRHENICRDALLSDLKQRLNRYGVGARGDKEGHVVDEKRADIMVSYGPFVVPIEAKKEGYSTRRDGKQETVWTGLRSQLINCYVREPAADGCGIYLVFWFGGHELPTPPSGATPTTAADLEDALASLLTSDDGRIRICVIDCTRP